MMLLNMRKNFTNYMAIQLAHKIDMRTLIFLIPLISINLMALEPKNIDDMSCIELLDSIKALEKIKERETSGNYEVLERIALAALTQTVYFGDRRHDGEKINVKKEIALLKSKLPNCKPF